LSLDVVGLKIRGDLDKLQIRGIFLKSTASTPERARGRKFLGKGVIMKRAVIATLIFSLAFALPAFAVESNEPQKGPAPTFEQRKAQDLKRLDDRSTKLQEEKACVQATKNDNDLKACREKFRPPHGPGGKGHPGRPGGPTPPGGKPSE
jgi:hypothetical protein